jgi:enoyl-CoA hydratase/carnithine racemase
MLTATEAHECGTNSPPQSFFFGPLKCLMGKGLVDYVSTPNSTGFERALDLASDIASNGEGFSPPFFIPFTQPQRILAPLALRAAKQAISRSEDLALEPGT